MTDSRTEDRTPLGAEGLNEQKKRLRKDMKVQLKAMDPKWKNELDHLVYEQVVRVPEIGHCDRVLAYMALSWETGTTELLEHFWNHGIRVALPRVSGSEMDFFEVSSFDDLSEGAYHILEPGESCPCADWPEAPILVPGLAFSRDGRRLGKGGGYYDKYLEKHPNHATVALAYEFQITDAIPAAAHDQPVDIVVTEEHSYR